MSAISIPVLKLPELPRESVFKKMTVENIIHVSQLSEKARNAIHLARIVPKYVLISCYQDHGDLTMRFFTGPELNWSFKKREDEVVRNATFPEMMAADQVQGDGLVDEVKLLTIGADWRSAMIIVLREMKHLFHIKIVDSCILDITGDVEEILRDELIQEIDRCKSLSLCIMDPGQNTLRLTPLLNKIQVEHTLQISNQSENTITFNQQFPMEKLVFGPRHNWSSISLQYFTNITHLHFLTECHVPLVDLNSLLREWKQGGLPTLQLIEHLGVGWRADHTYMSSLLEGLEDQEWDTAREQTFAMRSFNSSARLMLITNTLMFRQGRDITRNDGTKGTVIPCLNSVNKFVFMVWSGWMKQHPSGIQYNRDYRPRLPSNRD